MVRRCSKSLASVYGLSDDLGSEKSQYTRDLTSSSVTLPSSSKSKCFSSYNSKYHFQRNITIVQYYDITILRYYNIEKSKKLI